MKKLLLGILFLTILTNSYSQTTWANGAADVIFNNCTSCHNPNGIAPFSLLDYNVASENSADLLAVVLDDIMPPWTANSEYQSYSHDRRLTPEEKQTLIDWVDDGAQQGDPEDVPPPPVYENSGFITAPADLEVQMPEYASNASAYFDDYVCFSLPLGLDEDKKLRAFEVIPGNPNIVHHCLIFRDPTGEYPTDTEGICNGPTEGLLGGYTPGSFPTVFPSDGEDFNMGMTITAGSNLVLAMHYPEGSAGEIDSTKIRLFFYEDDVNIREITTSSIIENWSFTLPPNVVTEVEADFSFIPTDFSLLSVFPHMHLIGDRIKSYAVSPENDTIPLVDIPHWDFEWQEFLFFEEIQVVPAWSTIYGEGAYDNTSSNPHNPNDPPITVYPGLNTTDEMFLVYFHYTPYVDGDELVNLEELTQLPVGIDPVLIENNISMDVYPNPFLERVDFKLTLEKNSKVSLFIYDANGRVVDKLIQQQNLNPGMNQFQWIVGNDLPSGLYHYSLLIDGISSSGKIVKE